MLPSIRRRPPLFALLTRGGWLAEGEGGQEFSVGEWVDTLGIVLPFTFFFFLNHLFIDLAVHGVHTSAVMVVVLFFVVFFSFVNQSNSARSTSLHDTRTIMSFEPVLLSRLMK